ncbi:hypothetical protein MPH_05588 [Macrophomina phaseolina MS6]|uniref:Uncharacterized protein n=1 Tax=Macrophomina phaseolina (strain MS6) TaxID=1126212 RepID=K2SK67_MACPH|nr:hypothetical protein MPH_05588 [Macrophomina phaseolina MS6]
MAGTLSRGESLALLSLLAACIGILANTFQGDGEPLIASLAFSGIAFASCYALIRWLGAAFMRAGFKGRDLSKLKNVEIPETMGAVCAVVYLFALLVFIPFPFYKDIVAATSGGGNKDMLVQVQEVETGRFLHRFPHNKVDIRAANRPSILLLTLLSLPRTCRQSSPFRPSFSLASVTIYSTSAGGTKS